MTMRIGIIGFGQRARMHELLRNPELDAQVTAVCDTSERGRTAAAAELPLAFVTESLDELLAQPLDAVMVLTPDDQHAEPVIRSLEAGLAVFTEKPVATTLEDADRILATAHRTGSRLYVGHNMRHMPVVVLMKQLIDDGRIGEVKAATRLI